MKLMSFVPFTVIYNQWLLTIKPYYAEGDLMFKVIFPGEILLDIYPVSIGEDVYEWKAVIEGSKHIVDEIGELIREHLTEVHPAEEQY